MSNKKQYKNVYTILEKVKKGEIQSYYKNSDGLFGKVNFYKKKDLVKPHLHYLDERNLHHIISSYISMDNTNTINKLINNTLALSKNPTIQSNRGDFIKKVIQSYSKFPEHIEKDVFKMFYNKIDNIEFEDRTDKNKLQYKFLEKANNPVAKIMTEGGSLKSSIFTKEIMMQYAIRMALLSYEDPEKHENMQNQMNGEGGNSPDASDIFDNLMNNKNAQNDFERAMHNATETCKSLDDILSEDLQEKLFDKATKPGKDHLSAGKISPDYLRTVSSNITSVKMSMSSIKNILKKLLDRSISQFSAKPLPIYEDLFNSDNIANLDDYISLHPKLRKFMAEDVLIKDNKYCGKLNLYIDISGSMSDPSGIKSTNGRLSKIEFAKAFAAQMLNLEMLDKIYLFNNNVIPIKTSIIDIAMIDSEGGTTIDKTVNHVKNVTNANSIIITDAEDHCTIYDDKVFFIGIKGAKFHYFSSDILNQYVDNEQIVVFDGNTISKVNNKGHVIV